MFRILVPVNGSNVALEGVRHAIQLASARSDSTLYLVNTQPMLNRHLTQFVSQRAVNDARHARGSAALAEVRALVEAAGIAGRSVVLRGEPVTAIARFAAAEGIDAIVIGVQRKCASARLLCGSTANRLLARATVPVTIVQTPGARKLARWVVPAAGVGLAAALLLTD